jgi:hypothetical protein
MGVLFGDLASSRAFCHFFLDKKVTKKSSLSKASPLKANAPLAGQAVSPPRWINPHSKEFI